MTTYHTVTANLESLLTPGLRSPVVTVRSNVPASAALVDLDNNKIIVSSDRVQLVDKSTFSISLIDTAGAGTNVPDGSLRWTIQVDYTDARGARKTWICGDFTLTADLDLSDAVATADPPATIANQYLAQMQALIDEAEAITGLTGEDAAIAAIFANPASATHAALSATYAPGGTAGNIDNARGDVRYVGKYAVYDVVKDGGADPTGVTGDLGAIINAGYAALIAVGGGKILIPPGDFRQTTPAVVGNGRQVAVIGYGSALTRIQPTSALAGAVVLDINGASTFSTWQATKHGGFAINGTNCPTATGLNYGDLTGGHLDDIEIDNFNGKGGIGLQFINRSHWTERTLMTRIAFGRTGGNSTNWAFTVSGSSFASFGYTRALDVRFGLWSTPVTATVASVTVTSGSVTATVASGGFTGVSTGMAVQSSNALALQGATTVAGVSGNTLTLSMPSGFSGTVTMYFAPSQQIAYSIGQDAQVYHGTFGAIFNCAGGVAGTSLWPLVMFNNAQNTADTGRGFMQNELDWVGETDNHTVGFLSANVSSSMQCYGRVQFPGPSLMKFGTFAAVKFAGDLWMPGLLGPDGAHDTTVGGLRKFSNAPGDYTLSNFVIGTGGYQSFAITDDGKYLTGPGATALDTRWRRTAAGVMTVDDNTGAGGAVTLGSGASLLPLAAGTCSTAVSTAAKTVTISGYTLTAGHVLAITFTNGSQVSNATLAVNGGSAIAINSSGTVGQSTFSPASGAVCLLYYDGTTFWSVGIQNGQGVPSQSEAEVGTATTPRFWTAKAAKQSVANTQVNTQTGTAYTFALTDAGCRVEGNNASAITFTIPPNSSVAFSIGTWIEVEQYGAGAITIAAGAGVTLRSRGALVNTNGQYSVVRLYKRATDEWVLSGDRV